MMQMFRYKVSLKLKGPVLSKATTAVAYGKDALMARDTQGRYYLPKSLIKGRLRQAYEELREAVGDQSKFSVEEWLGEPSDSRKNQPEKGVEPLRGRLYLSDFVYRADCQAEEGNTLHRISIDQDRGSVKSGALQIIEAPFAPGAEVYFDGEVEFIAEEEHAENIINEVKTGLRWTTSFGACRTIGFGTTISVDIEKIASVHSAELERLPDSELDKLIKDKKISLVVRPNGPFCFAKKPQSENIFESEISIPGAALKAGVVTMWGKLLGKDKQFIAEPYADKDRNELCKYFEKIRFTHAFPSKENTLKRPITPPLSLVIAEGKCYDAALCKNPMLIEGVSPAFSVDWKDRSDVEAKLGWPDVSRDLRVRTAIDRVSRRHKDKSLFASESVIADGCEWLAHIDFSDVPDDHFPEVAKQLYGLLVHGFVGWSKTKISAAVEVKPADHIKPAVESVSKFVDNVWILTLQTPAILCDPAKITKASGDTEMEDAYKAAWEDISKSALKLKWYFASQSLVGGYYLHRRFQEGKPYNPYLLTDAGSVFVFSAAENVSPDDAKDLIEKWLKGGLPFPDWAKDTYAREKEKGDHWSNCPYIPQNGYGEITVNIMHGFEKLKEVPVGDGR